VQDSTARSPTLGLILGLAITVAAVVAYAWYTTAQISGLRKLQNEFADRNRKDSLQLLRIQNDLNSLGLAMRDMLESDETHPLAAWSAEFERIHADLDDALRLEAQLAVAARIFQIHSRNSGTQPPELFRWRAQEKSMRLAISFGRYCSRARHP
jgi:hypothetical protein